MNQNSSVLKDVLKPAVIVGALGYFVDVYDLILFSMVRIPSLKDLGFSGDALVNNSALLLNMQMIGMLLGGIFFGILGDRLGRVTLLFGSILIYSVANIANGFSHSIESYAIWRFIAGFGLSGELGGCITLVSEILPQHLRGYGTTVISTVGVFGAVVGGWVATKVHWTTSYFIAGGLGLFLLILRLSVAESGMFKQLRTERDHVSRGNFLMLFTKWTRVMKYFRCILVGFPLWCIVGVLVTFSPEIAGALKISETIVNTVSVPVCYTGITLGGFVSGFLSQKLRSRRKVLFGFLVITTFALLGYFMTAGQSSRVFYWAVFALGFGVGYWTIFATIAAEQFGTNIRATVATTVPNFVRGATVLFVWSFTKLKPHYGPVIAAEIVAAACMVIAFWAVTGLGETYDKNLDYLEPI